MKQTEEKTNVMRTLDRLRIPYAVHHPNDTTNALSGVEIARQLNQPPERVFKTLVTTGHSGKHYVFIIPAAAELDLKKAAQAVREKSIAMLLQAPADRLCSRRLLADRHEKSLPDRVGCVCRITANHLRQRRKNRQSD